MAAEGTGTSHTNGYVRWPDLENRLDRVRDENCKEVSELASDTQTRFERAHNFYSDAVGDQMRLIEKMDKRVDTVETILDHQRGAWTLAKWLIGSNLALTVVGILTLVALFQ
jgi:hypothetical protein